MRAGYIALLEEMGRLPYAYRVVFFYFLNGLFLEAWAHHVPEEGPWAELSQHWFAPEFQAVLYDLEVLARGLWEDLDPEVVRTYLRRILEAEKATWSLLL